MTFTKMTFKKMDGPQSTIDLSAYQGKIMELIILMIDDCISNLLVVIGRYMFRFITLVNT